jgi:pimeloyl-ACP methyl ester carboxylesterase
LAALAACAPIGAKLAAAQGGEDIHVRAVGDGASTWVLLHPFAASGRFFEARAAALCAQYHVSLLAPDLPSHGRSRIVERFDYNAATDAIERALAPHRASIALIVGASSGGVIALKLAARLRRPVAAVGVGYAFSAENIASMRGFSQALPEATDQYVHAFLEQGDGQGRALQRHFGDLAEFGQGPLFSADELAALADRTLIMNGASDDFFMPESAHALAGLIPRSTVSFATGAGHLAPLAPPYRDFTWATIGAFLATRTAS